MGYGGESKAERGTMKAEMKRDHGERKRETREESPNKVLKTAGISVKGEHSPKVDDRMGGNAGNISHAVRKLERDTERKEHAPMVGGHKNDHKTH